MAHKCDFSCNHDPIIEQETSMTQPATPNSLIEGAISEAYPTAATSMGEVEDRVIELRGFRKGYAAALADRAQRPSSVAGTGTLDDLVMPPTRGTEAALAALLTRIDDAAENYERLGEVCRFEGNAMIYAATLEEIVVLRGEYHAAAIEASGQPVPGAGRNAQPDQPESSSLAPTVAGSVDTLKRYSFDQTGCEEMDEHGEYVKFADVARLAPAAPSGAAGILNRSAFVNDLCFNLYQLEREKSSPSSPTAPGQQAQAVPEGFALVPLIPTEAMNDAYNEVVMTGIAGSPAHSSHVWEAMIAANTPEGK